MKTMHKGLVAFALLLLVLCMAIPAALAAPASAVTVNGVTLNASLPYWKNGSTSAVATEPADGWNAYFNASTGTLTLQDAVVNRASLFLSSDALICAMGDLSLVLRGTSTVKWNNSAYSMVSGIVTTGALAISGDGSIDVEILNTNSDGTAIIALAYGAITVSSGNITGLAQATSNMYGLYSLQSILVAGGQIAISGTAEGATGVFPFNSEFRMTDGSLTVNVGGTSAAANTMVSALFCSGVSLEGGSASFAASGSAQQTTGLRYSSNTVSYSGGTFTFVGATSALFNYIATTNIQYTLSSDAAVYASRSTDGSSSIVWKSDADGRLTSQPMIPAMSDFHYVRFAPPVIQPQAQPPQTGDSARPWLWAGIALLGLLGITGLAHKRCKARA